MAKALADSTIRKIGNLSQYIAEQSVLPQASEACDVHELLRAMNEFMECVRYLNTRRSKGTILRLESEADVQDALYLMLRPWIRDLVAEYYLPSSANRTVIADFYSKQARTLIEVKYIRDKAHGKGVSKELHDDIEMYKNIVDCEAVIFFIYDPETLIPNVESLTTAIRVDRRYGDRSLSCHLIVKP